MILLVTTGEGTGPAGEISPVVCMLKNGLGEGNSLSDILPTVCCF